MEVFFFRRVIKDSFDGVFFSYDDDPLLGINLVNNEFGASFNAGA